MFFSAIVLTTIILAVTLLMRKTRGQRIKDSQRGIEKFSVWKVKGRKIHFHHSYLGFLLLPIGFYEDWIFVIAISLIISDLLFHLIARLVWHDPFWD